MLKFHPQPTPQLKLAVPLPFADIVKTWKDSPAKVESPHCPWVLTTAFLPLPAVLSVTLTSMLTKPHPLFPVSVICQGPDKSNLVIVPIVAELGLTE